MSEAQAQASEIQQLSKALIEARAALEDAERATQAYADAVMSGKESVSIARVAELEAAQAVAKATEDAASAAVRAAAKQATAQAQAAAQTAATIEHGKRLWAEITAAEEQAARAADAAWSAANERGRVATLVAKEHERAVAQLQPAYTRLNAAAAAKNTFRDAASGIGMIASAAPMAIGVIGGLIHVLGEGVREADTHNRAVRALGGAYAEVQRQTQGAVTAEEALRLQGSLLNAEIHVTAEQMGVLMRAAREASLEMGGDLSQSVEQLSAGVLQGSAEQLRRFGLTASTAASQSARLADIVRQLSERQAGVAPTARTASEGVDQFGRAAKEAGSEVATTLAGGLVSAADWFVRLTTGGDSATTMLKNFARELRDARGQDDNANSNRALARIREQTQQYELQRRAFQNSSLLEGTDIRLPISRDLSVQQRREMVELFQESEHLSVTEFQNRTRRILALRQQQQAAQAAQREAAELQQRVDAQNAADRAAHAHDDLGLLRAQLEKVGLRTNMQQATVTAQQRLNYLQREMGRLLQDEVGNRAAIQTAAQEMLQIRAQQRQEAEEANRRAREHREILAAQRLHSMAILDARLHGEEIWKEAQGIDETRLQYAQRMLQLQQQHNQESGRAVDLFATLRQQAAAELAAQEANDQQLRDKAHAQAQLDTERFVTGQQRREEQQRQQNEAWSAERHRQLDSTNIETQVRQQFGMAEEHVQTIEQRSVAAAKNAFDAFGQLGAGVAQAMATAAASGEDMGAAIAKQVDDWAAAKAVQWGLQSVEALAGAGVAWFIRPDAVPGLLASAASYAALAGAAGVTAAAIPNAPAASGGGAGGAGRDQGLGLAASSRGTSTDAAPPASIVFNVSGFTSTESAQEGIVRALREAESRGLELGFLR